MGLFNSFKKFYTINCRCYNCGMGQECKIPKGNTIDSWLASPEAICANCGNPTLRRITTVKAPANVQEPSRERQEVKYPHQNKKTDFKLNPSNNFWMK